MARRTIRTGKLVGWPAVGLGTVLIVFGIVAMVSEGAPVFVIVGWGVIGLVIVGAFAASELGHGPRFERRQR